jgi:hypothetical protein
MLSQRLSVQGPLRYLSDYRLTDNITALLPGLTRNYQ